MQIIRFPFKKVLTNGEMHKLEKRIDEIDVILDLCADTYDSDIIDNLMLELDYIYDTLTISLNNLERKAN